MLNLVLSLSLSDTGHWKFNMAPHGKDLKKRIVVLHKNGVGYKKIANTLKLSCSTVARTIQRGITGQVTLRTSVGGNALQVTRVT